MQENPPPPSAPSSTHAEPGLNKLAAEAGADMDRNQRRHMNKQLNRAVNLEATRQVMALKEVATGSVATTQLALKVIQAMIVKEMEIQPLRVDGKEVIILWVDKGRDVSDEVCDQLAAILRKPFIVLSRDVSIEALDRDKMEAAGWTRKGPKLVDAGQDENLQKS